MATLDRSQCSAVESIPGKASGAWVFRGTRVPVAAIFENLKTSPIEEVLENFHVTRDQVQTVLDFAAKSTRAPLEQLRAGSSDALRAVRVSKRLRTPGCHPDTAHPRLSI